MGARKFAISGAAVYSSGYPAVITTASPTDATYFSEPNHLQPTHVCV